MKRSSPTLAAYIGRRFLGALLAALGGVGAIIVIVSVIELTKRASERDVDFPTLLAMALLQTPEMLLKAAPFIVLLASLATYARLARSSEIAVARAAGLSVWALAAAPVLAATLFGVLSFTVFNPLVAATAQRLEIMENRHLHGASERLSVSADGLWLREPGPYGGVEVLEARDANGSATTLNGLTIYRFDATGALHERIDAEKAALGFGVWRLSGAVRRRIDADAADLAGQRFELLDIPTDLTADRILESFAPPEQVSFWRMPAFIAELEEAGFSAKRFRAYWHSEIAAPLLFAAMAAIGAGFAQRHPRLGGLGIMALGAALSGFGLFFVTDVAKALGASGAIPAELAAWAPPGAAALFAASLLLWRDES